MRPPPLPPAAPSRLLGTALLGCLVLLLAVPPAVALGEDRTGDGRATDEARRLLETAVAALERPHVGRVTVVSFGATGPRVADLDVRVAGVTGIELRRPTRWLVGGDEDGWLRTPETAVPVPVSATGSGLDVAAVLERWEVEVGAPAALDTGTATPVHLVRRSGAAVEEVVYVDTVTGLPVRRETRDADGAVLRVVAYTEIAPVDVAAGGEVATVATDEVSDATLAGYAAEGYAVPRTLGAGFELVSVGHHGDAATARYGDGLSVLSLYQQHGRLDPASLEGAQVRSVAGRDVWAWPGAEPLRLVWTGGDRTWTLVSDAPVQVVEDALAELPGDAVGHDVPARVTRGLRRAWSWLTDVVG